MIYRIRTFSGKKGIVTFKDDGVTELTKELWTEEAEAEIRRKSFQMAIYYLRTQINNAVNFRTLLTDIRNVKSDYEDGDDTILTTIANSTRAFLTTERKNRLQFILNLNQ